MLEPIGVYPLRSGAWGDCADWLEALAVYLFEVTGP